ncbi:MULTISPECIES: DUF362 domain-containing protein [Dethiosulfovibrio]|uniref:DUF362 domain-containing protein n=2 Tax=Dethiosulfovibrio TaxID=47054 RepID=A0ABS9EQD5_9BACT|nr:MULTISPECIES: DUF362 domain-containing protein [Dethiosulfovibrio]MCF4114972.1 DUF362 domain-containing protein [Dethiosulfovibrio russensis]MCF4143414.1 DUF362 domain-containing protein [Dethiosulfovibrio marinus]MCF4145930.1 DUF362 domain-containing protein [Dethiosulfovibrio acidaminovorans]
MTIVSFRKCSSYEGIKDVIARTIDDLGGMRRFVSPGDSVLIKPNMLGAYSPDRAVTTHPSMVKAMTEMILDCGGKPTIADSPGIEKFSKVAEKTGIAQVGKILGVPVVPLGDSRPVPGKRDDRFRGLEISALALESDRIINLPKLKTHCQMTLTMGVKNLFGTVVAQRKAAWHYRVGLDRENFARLLLEIWTTLRPGLTVMDGVIGMEGRGPSNGSPRRFGTVVASDNALSMDLVTAELMSLDRSNFPLRKAAETAGMVPKNIRIKGDPITGETFEKVQLPPPDSLRLLPSWMDRFGRELLAAKPEQDRESCILCGRCVEICPADAITMRGSHLVFDYGKCIRCYCCHEMCPADAIRLRQNILLRGLEVLGR